MKKLITIIFLNALFLTCPANDFFDNCQSNTIKFTSASTKKDKFNTFGINMPNSGWVAINKFDGVNNSITLIDTITKSYRSIAVFETPIFGADTNNTWESNQIEFEKRFDVIQTGEININGKLHHYNLIKSDSGKRTYKSLLISIYHPSKHIIYTIDLCVEENQNSLMSLCELEEALSTFKVL